LSCTESDGRRRSPLAALVFDRPVKHGFIVVSVVVLRNDRSNEHLEAANFLVFKFVNALLEEGVPRAGEEQRELFISRVTRPPLARLGRRFFGQCRLCQFQVNRPVRIRINSKRGFGLLGASTFLLRSPRPALCFRSLLALCFASR
jgi:hypothetical protein